MNRFTYAAFIVLAIAPVLAEEKFDLGDLVEIVSLLPVIIDGIVGFLAICRADGLGIALAVVMVYTTVSVALVMLLNTFFGSWIQEFSKKKYQPLRIAVNVWANSKRGKR